MDEIEQLLLENRKRPIAIASRAIIRAGKGNKYWSKFPQDTTSQIEALAKKIHSTLFDPEISTPIKTLDLPLGGSKGIRSALQTIIEFIGIACISQTEKTIPISYGSDDLSGEQTLKILRRTEKLVNRITGNSSGSLGLHPAIYYYGPSGVHSSPLFLGTAKFISEKLSNNDSDFFKKFSLSRESIEKSLIENKELIATALQKLSSRKRVDSYSVLLNKIFLTITSGNKVTESNIVDWTGVAGKVIVGEEKNKSNQFSDSAKSKIFINTALKNAVRCTICSGFIDAEKSLSYDHIVRKRDGGDGNFLNGQLTHPYCNQSVKN